MRAAELRKMERFFSALTSLQRYMVTTAAAADEAGDCACEITTAGIYAMRAGSRCAPTGPEDPPPDYCRTLTHLAARIQLEQLRLPVDHLSDPQLDTAIAELAALVDQAPQLTEPRFVVRLQEIIRTSLAPLAAAAGEQPSEETPDQ